MISALMIRLVVVSIRVENCIPLPALFGLSGSASASPASPLNPDTLRRKLSVSGPTENDEYSPEYHKPVFLCI